LLDLRGHGASQKKGRPYSVARFAKDINELLEHLSIEEIILCGHSLGGMISQQFVAMFPAKVKKLVLADTSYSVRATRAEALSFNMLLPVIHYTPVARQARIFSSQLGKYSAGTGAYVYRELSAHASDRENYRAIWRAVTNFDGYDNLKEIRCPTLILVAGLNSPTHRQANVMRTLIPDSRLVTIDGAGHMLNWDNTQQFNSAVQDFVEAQSPERMVA